MGALLNRAMALTDQLLCTMVYTDDQQGVGSPVTTAVWQNCNFIVRHWARNVGGCINSGEITVMDRKTRHSKTYPTSLTVTAQRGDEGGGYLLSLCQ